MIKIGDKLGNFLIRAEIGRGGMGTIYFAVDTMLNREVALKVIHPELADNQQLMERFKIEAMTQARLNHPNIVMIFSFNKIEDEYVIAMEYVEGRSLKEAAAGKKAAPPGRSRRDRHPGRRRPALRPQPQCDPPRHQAGEHHDRQGQQGKDFRFRHRQDLRRPRG